MKQWGMGDPSSEVAQLQAKVADMEKIIASLSERVIVLEKLVVDDERRLAAEIDPWAPLYWPESLAARAAEGLSGLRLAELVFTRFAVLAMALATFSLFVVLMFLVVQRRREYAVRAAVGATPLRLFLGVLGEGGRTTAAGLVLGMAVAYAAMRLVDAALEGAAPWRGSAALMVVVVLLLAAFASSAWPAWRAFRVPASAALRG